MSNDAQTVNDVRHANTKKVLQDHEDRITANERFRLRMQGALALIGFIIGGGAATTAVMYLSGAM